MIQKDMVVSNKTGLHMRPAHHVVREAKKYACTIQVVKKKDGKSANLKSLVSLLKISINQNSEIKLIFEGEDEKAASEAIEKTISSLID